MVSQRQSNPVQVDFPEPPRFIDHQELSERGVVHRLFRTSDDPPQEGRLSRQEEVLLFKRMQYCGYRMSKMWDRLENLTAVEQKRYLKWYKQYNEIRARVVSANMGLVFDMLSKSRFRSADFDELRSEGLLALLRSVDTYNPWSGFRFSTYACNSIINAFSRVALMERKRSHLWVGSFDPNLEPVDTREPRRSEHLGLMAERLVAVLNDRATPLSENEKYVLRARFPLQPEARRATLQKLGDALQVSKERVRQIQASALGKLRRALVSDSVLQ